MNTIVLTDLVTALWPSSLYPMWPRYMITIHTDNSSNPPLYFHSYKEAEKARLELYENLGGSR